VLYSYFHHSIWPARFWMRWQNS